MAKARTAYVCNECGDQALTVTASMLNPEGEGGGARKAHARDSYRRGQAGLERSQHLRPGSAILP
ncbi:hypothetical protein C7E17_25275, partial [Stenotrophomonas maltophilia]